MKRKYKERAYSPRITKLSGITKQYLEKEYVNNGRSLPEIAREWGVPYRATWLRAKRLGILVRREKRRMSIIGKKIGSFEILSFEGKTSGGATLWKAKCLCGSIGVYKLEKFKPDSKCKNCASKERMGEMHPLWNGFKEISGSCWSKIECSAKAREIQFLINKEHAWSVFNNQEKKCAITGVSISISSGTASLDRIDNHKGYIPGNVHWVHKIVNRMKWDMSMKDFIFWCQSVSNHQATKPSVD